MTTNITAAIIEDEFPAARLLKNMIQELRPNWEVLLLPGTIEESCVWFQNNPQPDILFLDIQLTDGNSFLFIEKARPQCAIVFTTAFDEYAVQAFSVNSIDYLLKPIHKERLEESITRFEKYHARRLFSPEDNQAYLENILSAIGQTGAFRKYRQRFLITSPRRMYTISIPEIAYFYSEDKILFAVTFDGKTHILDLTLNKLEEQLDPELFFRANRQVLLSANCIELIEPHFNGKMLLQLRPKAKEQILVSREKVGALKMWLNK